MIVIGLRLNFEGSFSQFPLSLYWIMFDQFFSHKSCHVFLYCSAQSFDLFFVILCSQDCSIYLGTMIRVCVTSVMFYLLFNI